MKYSIGIDISAETYTCSCSDAAYHLVWYGKTYAQTLEGWQHLDALLTHHAIARDDVQGIIMENTGCYSENMCHWLFEQQYAVYVEPPKRIKKALSDEKTDEIDSGGIAQYLFRYADKVHPWQPPDEITEQIRLLLKTYEDLARIETKSKNKLTSYHKKHHSYELIETMWKDLESHMRRQKRQIEKHLHTTINTNPRLKQKTQDIMALKYTGIIMASHLLVCTHGYTDVDYPRLARYLGVYPLKYTSGTSIKAFATSRGSGPEIVRKNLYTTVMRLIAHHDDFKRYYTRKLAEGKRGKVAFNNTVNKFLRTVCGVLKSDIPYTKSYRSVKPE